MTRRTFGALERATCGGAFALRSNARAAGNKRHALAIFMQSDCVAAARFGMALASVVAGKHDSHHAAGDARIGRILAAKFEGKIIIIDLEEQAFGLEFESAEVALAVRVICSELMILNRTAQVAPGRRCRVRNCRPQASRRRRA